jgi:beta-galactosidase
VLDERVDIPGPGEPLRVNIENRSNFADLSEYAITWSLGGKQTPVAGSCAARGRGFLEIRTGEPVARGDVLTLTFGDPRGFECFSCRLPIGERVPSQSASSERTGAGWSVEPISGALTSPALVTGGPYPCIVPLRGGDGQLAPEPVTPFIPLCTDWKATRVKVSDAATRVEGSCGDVSGWYEVAPGEGGLAFRYRFTVARDINPRQWGIVFGLSPECDTLSWERNAFWSDYPQGHIGRPSGTAKGAAPVSPPAMYGRTEPTWSWESEGNELGTNDFRATRTDIRRVSLTAADGRGLTVESDGRHAARAWMSPTGPMLLVAGYNNAGAEGFFAGQSAHLRRPLKAGDVIEDSFLIRFDAPER